MNEEEMLLRHVRQEAIALEILHGALKEIQRLRTLLDRAEEVLQLYADYPISMVMSISLRERARGILAELRKTPE